MKATAAAGILEHSTGSRGKPKQRITAAVVSGFVRLQYLLVLEPNRRQPAAV